MALDLSGGLPVEREYVLPECPDQPDIRDAVNVWIEEKDAKFGMRIGIEATSPTWDRHMVWLDIAFADGRVMSLRSDDEPVHPAIGPEGLPTIRGAGPLTLRLVEPFKTWTASFKGKVPETTADALIKDRDPDESLVRDVEFEIEMNMALPPLAPGSMLPEARTAMTSADQGQFISPRYEQLFRAKGALRIDDERHDFTGQGLRIRRTGFRKFEGFWGHCWQSALFPSGKGFGFNTFPPRGDGTPNFAEGFVSLGDGTMKPARPVEVPWMKSLTPRGDDVPIVLETEDGLVRIEGTTFINTRSRSHPSLPPDFPIVQQAHALYRWGDEEATGMIERSSRPSVMDL